MALLYIIKFKKYRYKTNIKENLFDKKMENINNASRQIA